MDTTHVYSSKAAKYARYRWDYAPEAIQTILDVTGVADGSSIADIGAGTGILTRHLVGSAGCVYAVEPNEEMRRVAARELGPHPACRVIDGQAEATTLPDCAVDLITVAQAIHWFEPEPTRAEFLRILKPGGWLAVLRNYGTDRELDEAINAVLTQQDGVDRSPGARLPEGKPLSYFYGSEDFSRRTFPFTRQVTWEGFMGALASASYAPDEDSPRYGDLERAVREVFDRFSAEGLLTVRGATELYLGQVVR